MTSEQLQETALYFDEKADQFHDAGHVELAEKFREGSRAALDASFPFYPSDIARATAKLEGIFAWLEEFDARL